MSFTSLKLVYNEIFFYSCLSVQDQLDILEETLKEKCTTQVTDVKLNEVYAVQVITTSPEGDNITDLNRAIVIKIDPAIPDQVNLYIS